MTSLIAVRPGVQIGDTFRRLTVIGVPFYARVGKERRQFAVCQCECGRCVPVKVKCLKNGDTKSCGCWNDECRRSVKHGHKRRKANGGTTLLYQVWCGVRARCLSPTNKRYADYGGRGITIDPKWLESYQAFYDWAISSGWKQGLCLDRIDNDGPYSPMNCRFVTYKINNGNKREYRKRP